MRETIRKIEVFADLGDRLLQKIADSAITCTYGQHERILREGEVGIGMYFIVRGRVAVVRGTDAGEVRVGEIGPNEFVAEMALIDDKPRAVSVVTTEETECVLFTRDTFRRLTDEYPAITIRLVRVMAEKIREAYKLPPRTGKVALTAAAAPADAIAVSEPVADGNGNATGVKASVEKKLLDLFEMLYVAKAMTRFSVAVLGCPVTGSGSDALEVIRVGEVSAVLLPSTRPAELTIAAWGAGEFQLHVFHPDHFEGSGRKPLRFEPEPIQPCDRFTLFLPAAVLTREPLNVPESLV